MLIEIIEECFTVCKVESVPQELLDDRFCFIGKTDKELSLVCKTELVPAKVLEREDGWRGMRVTGTLDFSLIGILSRISSILAEAGVGIFVISTYDTDYVLVKENMLEKAADALIAGGIDVTRE
ncbi:MAG: ACT domain-containing protein [Oscillospiraceae bacterium]|nr:ACT domain-containing protein [Oscillospiraceae bacterium]